MIAFQNCLHRDGHVFGAQWKLSHWMLSAPGASRWGSAPTHCQWAGSPPMPAPLGVRRGVLHDSLRPLSHQIFSDPETNWSWLVGPRNIPGNVGFWPRVSYVTDLLCLLNWLLKETWTALSSQTTCFVEHGGVARLRNAGLCNIRFSLSASAVELIRENPLAFNIQWWQECYPGRGDVRGLWTVCRSCCSVRSQTVCTSLTNKVLFTGTRLASKPDWDGKGETRKKGKRKCSLCFEVDSEHCQVQCFALFFPLSALV